jgi:hypothetical protein
MGGAWIPAQGVIRHDDFIVTTKNENSSAVLSTEILTLHSVQGQNDIERSAFHFQSNDKEKGDPLGRPYIME